MNLYDYFYKLYIRSFLVWIIIKKFIIWHSYSCLVAFITFDTKAKKKLNICEFTKINLSSLNLLTSFSHTIYKYIYI